MLNCFCCCCCCCFLVNIFFSIYFCLLCAIAYKKDHSSVQLLSRIWLFATPWIAACQASLSITMWELDCEESWALKNWCFWTVVLEKTLESLLDSKKIEPVHRKGNQSWRLTGRTDAEAETLILWPPDAKNWFIGKDPDAGKDWRREEKGITEDEMVAWHHWLNGHEFLGVGDGQRGLVCCSPWGHKELDTTEQLNLIEQQNVTKFSKDIQFLHVRSIQLLQLKRLNYGYFLFENRWLKTGRKKEISVNTGKY